MNHEVRQWFDEYRPNGLRPGAWTPSLRFFVEGCLEAAAPERLRIAQRYVGVLVGLGAWAQDEGLPLDAEVILSPAVVERYAVECLAGRGGATYRSDLRLLGRRITRRAPWTPPPAPLARRHVAAPYLDAELEAIWVAVDRQSTAQLRQVGRAVVALGAGAGLDGRWVARVSTADLHVLGSVVTVAVPEPSPRVVPVLSDFRDRLIDLAADVHTDRLIGAPGSGKNWLSRTVNRIEMPVGVPGLSTSRLRSSWLRRHLERGTRLPELAHAAGLEGLTVLTDLLPFVARQPFGTYCREVSDDGHSQESWTERR